MVPMIWSDISNLLLCEVTCALAWPSHGQSQARRRQSAVRVRMAKEHPLPYNSASTFSKRSAYGRTLGDRSTSLGPKTAMILTGHDFSSADFLFLQPRTRSEAHESLTVVGSGSR